MQMSSKSSRDSKNLRDLKRKLIIKFTILRSSVKLESFHFSQNLALLLHDTQMTAKYHLVTTL